MILIFLYTISLINFSSSSDFGEKTYFICEGAVKKYFIFKKETKIVQEHYIGYDMSQAKVKSFKAPDVIYDAENYELHWIPNNVGELKLKYFIDLQTNEFNINQDPLTRQYCEILESEDEFFNLLSTEVNYTKKKVKMF